MSAIAKLETEFYEPLTRQGTKTAKHDEETSIYLHGATRAPWLFNLTACRVSENKKFRIFRVLMFPVAAFKIFKSFSLLSSVE